MSAAAAALARVRSTQLRITWRGLLIAVVAVEAVLVYLLLAGQSWVYDDYFLLVLARARGFNLDWLLLSIFQHWNIGYHVVVSAQLALFPIDYRWGLALMLALVAGGGYLLGRSVALLARSELAGVLAAAYMGLSLLFVRPLEWWAGGLQAIPNTFFNLVVLYAWLRHRMTGTRGWLALCCLGLVGDLLFYEKAAFIVIYLALIRALIFSDSLAPRELARAFWRERVVWGSLLAIVGVWLVGYALSGAYSLASGAGVTAYQYVDYFRVMWFNTLAPAVIGLTIPQDHLSFGQALAAIAAQLAFLGAIAASVAHSRRAWRAWWFLVIAIVLTGALVARSRVAQFGVRIGHDPRYLVDFSWLIPLTVCFAFARRGRDLDPAAAGARPARGSEPGRAAVAGWSRGLRGVWRSRWRWPAILAALAGAGYVAASIDSNVVLTHHWPGPTARAWQGNLERALRAVHRRYGRVVFAEQAVPPFVMGSFVSPYNRYSRVLPLYDQRDQVDGPLDAPLETVTPDGRIHPASMTAVPGDSSAVAQFRAHAFTLFAVRWHVLGSQVCATADAVPGLIERSHGPWPAGNPYLRLDAVVSHPLHMNVFVGSAAGYPGVTDHGIDLAPGVATSIAWLGPQAPRKVRIDIPPRTTVCFGAISFVSVNAVA